MASPTDALRQKEAASSAPPQSAALQIDPRLVDLAHKILLPAQLDNDTKIQLWDAFHTSRNANHLADKLTPMDAPNEIKHQLFVARQSMEPVPSHTDKIIGAIQQMTQMD